MSFIVQVSTLKMAANTQTSVRQYLIARCVYFSRWSALDWEHCCSCTWCSLNLYFCDRGSCDWNAKEQKKKNKQGSNKRAAFICGAFKVSGTSATRGSATFPWMSLFIAVGMQRKSRLEVVWTGLLGVNSELGASGVILNGTTAQKATGDLNY